MKTNYYEKYKHFFKKYGLTKEMYMFDMLSIVLKKLELL